MESRSMCRRTEAYQSYLMRLMIKSMVGAEPLITVEIRCVQSGEAQRFNSLQAAVAYLDEQLKGMAASVLEA